MGVPSGLTVEELALTAYRAFTHAANVPTDAAGGEPMEGSEGGWLAMAAWAARFVETSDGADDSVDVAKLCELCHKASQIGFGVQEPEPFATVPFPTRVAFEAAVRHLFGAAACDPEEVEHIAEKEASWRSWALRRLEREGGNAA